MTGAELRKAERKRWVREIVAHIDEFPRQYAALEFAMAEFGDDFDLPRFKEAFDTTDDMDAYNRVQALERAVGRVQGFVADLAQAGVRLADLPSEPAGGEGFRARHAFEALRDAKVIDGALCRRLVRAQKARSAIEHEYVRLRAGKVHEATLLSHDVAREFFGRYRGWIEPYLD